MRTSPGLASLNLALGVLAPCHPLSSFVSNRKRLLFSPTCHSQSLRTQSTSSDSMLVTRYDQTPNKTAGANVTDVSEFGRIQDNQRKKMKRIISILIGLVGALVGLGLILPALAKVRDYGAMPGQSLVFTRWESCLLLLAPAPRFTRSRGAEHRFISPVIGAKLLDCLTPLHIERPR